MTILGGRWVSRDGAAVCRGPHPCCSGRWLRPRSRVPGTVELRGGQWHTVSRGELRAEWLQLVPKSSAHTWSDTLHGSRASTPRAWSRGGALHVPRATQGVFVASSGLWGDAAMRWRGNCCKNSSMSSWHSRRPFVGEAGEATASEPVGAGSNGRHEVKGNAGSSLSRQYYHD